MAAWHDFPNADAALGYGRGLCDRVGAGRPFHELVVDVMGDFSTGDGYHATYLISPTLEDMLAPPGQ